MTVLLILRATCFSEGGVPTLPPFLTCLFYLSKNGRVKNNWLSFLKPETSFRLVWATWRVGVREPRKAFMMSRRPCVFPSNMSFQWWRSCSFGFPRGCPPINSALCLLFGFFLLHFPENFLLLLHLLVLSFASLRKNLESSFVPAILYCDIIFCLRASFGTLIFALVVPFVAVVGVLVLVSDLFGYCLGKSLATVCWMLAFVGALGGFLRVFVDCFRLGFCEFFGMLVF